MGAIDPQNHEAERFTGALAAALGDRLVQVALFGSRARAQARPDSDYDLMVVVREADAETRRAVHTLALSFELDRYVSLSTKILAREQFESLRATGTRFWRSFMRDARTLWPSQSRNAS